MPCWARSVLRLKPTAKLHEESAFWKKGGARVEKSVSDEIEQENEGRVLVKGRLNPRRGQGGRGTLDCAPGHLGRKAELTPRVVAGKAAITQLEDSDPHLCAFRLRQGAHARHGRRFHTAPRGIAGVGA